MLYTVRTYRLLPALCLLLGVGVVLFGSSRVVGRTHRHSKKKGRSAASAVHSTRLSRQAELAKLNRAIAETERQLQEHTKQEHRTAKSLAAYDRKTKELKARLAGYKAQAEELQAQVEELDESITQTSSSITTLKNAYASGVIRRYVEGVYRKDNNDTTIFADLGTDADRPRRRYLSHIVSSAFHRNKSDLDSTKATLSENKEAVSETLNAELGQIDATRRAQLSAEEQKQQQAAHLKEIQSSKQALQKELEKRKASAKRLEGIIASLFAKEEAQRRAKELALKKRLAARKKKRSSGKKLTRTEEQQEAQDKIEAKSLAGPHSLAWPTASHKIVQGFGEHRNAELGTVTMNLGMDIGTAGGSTVRAAGDGVVSLISSLPSYGTIIIIRHGGGVHTVYADLSGVSVSSGSSVSKGQAIGTSGQNAESGAILHFEVWKGKSKQNPMRWLK